MSYDYYERFIFLSDKWHEFLTIMIAARFLKFLIGSAS